MATLSASDFVEASNRVSSDESIQHDSSSEYSDSDISDVRILGSEDRIRRGVSNKLKIS